MPATNKVIVTFTDKITDAEYTKAKDEIVKNGGKITHDYQPLMKSFAADIPGGYDLKGFQGSFADDKLFSIENDGTMTTQK